MTPSARRALVPIFLIVLVDVLGLTIVIPLQPLYAESLGASPLIATLLVPTYAACQLVSGPLLGQLSDRYGRRPLLIVSQVGTLIGFVIMARAQSLSMLFFARVLDGVTAGNLSIAQAYITDHTRPEERTRAFALIGIAFGFGFLVGPGITALLSSHGLAAPIWAAAALSLTSIVGTVLLLPRSEAPRAVLGEAGEAAAGERRLGPLDWGVYRRLWTQPGLGWLLAQFALYMLCFSTFTGGLALFAERRFSWQGQPFSTREVGLLFSFAGFVGLFVHGGLTARLVRLFGDPKVASIGLALLGAGYLLVGLAHGLPLLLVATAISSVGNGLSRPVLTSLVTQRAPAAVRGLALGLTQSLSSLASIIAPPMAGLLIEHHQLAGWALLSAALGWAALLLAPFGSLRPDAAPSSQQ